MSNQAKYNDARSKGVTHEEATFAVGVTPEVGRVLKNRYNKIVTPEAVTPVTTVTRPLVMPVTSVTPVTPPPVTPVTHPVVTPVTRPTVTPVTPVMPVMPVMPVTRNAGITMPITTAKMPVVNLPEMRTVLLGLLLIAPTVASVQNMAHVSEEIMGDAVGAISLTVVLSLTSLGFILAKVKRWYTYVLTFALIAFEAFANLTRIFAGLMDGGKYGTSEFLGRVCEVFESGSHYTAITIGTFTALLLAATQYATIYEINKA